MKPGLVVLTGAGISAESGLRTFRDSDGLWEGYNVYDVATPEGWAKDPKLVLDFYNQRRRDVRAASPNMAHTVLAELQLDFDVHIITQNIDDLHERAGSEKVLHLHGEIFKLRSVLDDNWNYPCEGDINIGDVDENGGQMRPDIVWFGEPVTLIENAVGIVQQADIFVVIGTSLVVYPAAGLLNFLPPHIPAYVIDKKLPSVSPRSLLTMIEKPATEGVLDLREALINFKK